MRIRFFVLQCLICTVAIITRETKAQVIAPNCSIERVYVDPGQYEINEQSASGFCKEWVVGQVMKARKFVISFVQNEVNCFYNDKLVVFDEHRNIVFDYCAADAQRERQLNYVFIDGKYIFVRLTTLSSRPIVILFNYLLLEPPVPSFTTASPTTITTTEFYPFWPSNERKPLKGECPSIAPKRILTSEGIIEITYSPVRSAVDSINCQWLIEAPTNSRVQIDFDYIDIPARFGIFGTCDKDYVAISSFTKPSQSYKICGQRKAVKIIVTYTQVLISLVAATITLEEIGFKMQFKVLRDPSITTVPAVMSSTTSPFIPPSFSCGVSYARGTEARIVGGQETVPHSFPWQVLITDGFIMCGAAIIDRDWLVTAAHCVQGISARMLKAYLGMHNRRVLEQNRVTRLISRIVIHSDYIGRMNQWDSDIALLKLQDSITFGTEIAPICLPPQGYNFATVGKSGLVTGWGETLGTGSSFVLRQTTITVSNIRDCGASSDNMICAGQTMPTLRDSCQGDSGGPFMIKYGKNYFLVGIVSWGYDCNGVGIYTKVSNYINWINSVTTTSSFY